MRILYVCEAEGGGIAEYALRQAPALTGAGAEVMVLCRPTFPVDRLPDCQVVASLPAEPAGENYLQKTVARIQDGREVARIAVETAVESHCDAVLMACYSEYFAPFWAGIYRTLAGNIPIGTIAHDPVRDFQLGPRWWHRWSVRQGYSFVRDVFVHDETAVDFGGRRPADTRVHCIPHGPFELAEPIHGREATRERYGISIEDRVFLAFGQIRDGKNLDRFLRAMPGLPADVKLLVAGSGDSASQRPPSFYQDLAKQLGVANRCFWDVRYIPNEDTGSLFAAADFLLMTYSAKFRSASGVMNAGVNARKPILCSSGPGPFQSAILDYALGIFVRPDDDAAILAGAREVLNFGPALARWSDYERDHSWQENAQRVTKALAEK